jgi:cold shock CspA family protein
MNLFTQLVVSLIAAAAATTAAIQFQVTSPLQLGLLIAVATCISPILNKIRIRSRSNRYSHSSSTANSSSSSSSASASTSGSSGASASSSPSSSATAKSHRGPREEGEVKWFNVSKGFGFICRDNGEEIFVHFRSIVGKDSGRRGLRDGQRVSYLVVESDKGPQAEEVEAV